MEGPDTSKLTQKGKVTGEVAKDGGIPNQDQEGRLQLHKEATEDRELPKCDNVSPIIDQEDCNSRVGGIVLPKDLCLGPGQTKLLRVDLVNSKDISPNMLKVITPNEGVLAKEMCDFAEEVWGCEPLPNITVSN